MSAGHLPQARHFGAEHALPADLRLRQTEEGLAQCHALGVVLHVRRLLLEGMGSAKRQLLPQVRVRVRVRDTVGLP